MLLPINPRTISQEAKLQVLNHLINCCENPFLPIPPILELQTKKFNDIDTWFELQKKVIGELLVAKIFFKVPDFKRACKEGTIYTPGGDSFHNWGVNASWALAITRSGLPIHILSDLAMENVERTHPNPNEALNPSAFALEIAIAIKMGYGLQIDHEVVNLTPPSHLADHITNGIPGNGPLPTKQEQEDMFRCCVCARGLHTMLLPPNGAIALQAQVHAICTGQDAKAKYDFVVGLKGNSLGPIFNALSLREYTELEDILNSQRFVSPVFGSLKEAVRIAQLSASQQAQPHVYPPSVRQEEKLPPVSPEPRSDFRRSFNDLSAAFSLTSSVGVGLGQPPPSHPPMTTQANGLVNTSPKLADIAKTPASNVDKGSQKPPSRPPSPHTNL